MDEMGILFIPPSSPLIPIHPLFIPARDEWVKVDPHSSPFPIHPTCPVITVVTGKEIEYLMLESNN